MKHLFTALMMVFAGFVMAQDHTSPAQTAAAPFTSILNLDAKQQLNMVKIETTKQKNLADIASLKTSDYSLYLKKRHSVAQGAAGSVRIMLRKEQMPLYEAYIREQRNQRFIKIKQLMATGASKEAIDEAGIADDF